MASLRSLHVSGAADFDNPAEEDQQAIRRGEYLEQIQALLDVRHAPVTVVDTLSIDLNLADGTQQLSAAVRRKVTNFAASEGLLAETADGLVVRLGSGTNMAAPGNILASFQSQIDSKASKQHTHAIADVSGLQDALDGKARASHSHAIADVTGLQLALDGKAAGNHTHAAATPTAAGFLSATDKARLDSLTAENAWLPSVATRDDLPLNTDPINALRMVQGQKRIYRHISNTGLTSDQWEVVGPVNKAAGTIGDGLNQVIDFVHGLGTADIMAIVRYAGGTQGVIDANWAPFDFNTVRMTFDIVPASGSLRVLVLG